MADTPSLKQAMTHWDWKIRNEAIRRAEVKKDTGAVSDLASIMKDDESPFVRASAARALGKIGSEKAVPALVKALDDPAFHVQQTALWALGDIGAGAASAIASLEPLKESTARFPQAELTVAQLAELTITRIQSAVEEAEAAKAEAQAAGEGEGAEGEEAEKPARGRARRSGLSEEERIAKREAALARKRARQQGEGG